MMVTFISQCEKNALKRTRRVLDAFANRIGDNTWQTIITQEGLNAVQKLLKKTASKSTAVSCHWIRSRSRSDFLWVVGNKDEFDENGVVAVNYGLTKRFIGEKEIMLDKIYANTNGQRLDQHLFGVGYLAKKLIEKIVPDDDNLAEAVYVAGLWHDMGKLDATFQDWVTKKLNKKYKDIPEEGEHVDKKSLWEKYPRHNEFSLLLFNILFDSESLANDKLSDIIKHTIYWHHAKPIRKEEMKTIIAIYDKLDDFQNKYVDVVNNIKGILDSITELSNEYDENIININKINIKKFDELEEIIADEKLPSYKQYISRNSISGYSSQIIVNAKNNLARTAIVTADRLISKLTAQALESHITNKTLESLMDDALHKDRGLRSQIEACLDGFETKYPNSQRNIKQKETAEDLSDEEINVGVLNGPAGCGKTKIALEWALNTSAKKIYWICPRVQVCQGIFDDLKTNEYLPNSSIEIVTGEIKKSLRNGKVDDTVEDEAFSSDIIITTIDQIVNSITTHKHITTLMDFMNAHVVFDEYHEYITMQGFNLLFAELIEAKKIQQTEDSLPNTLLVSATPNPLFITKFLGLDKDSIIGMKSFNESSYQIEFVEFDEKDETTNPLLQKQESKNCFVISNTATTAQLSFIEHQTNENAVLFHSYFTKRDKEKLFNNIFDAFKKDGSKHYDVLRSGPVVQASLNITCDKMISEMTHAENFLQRLGRLDRFGERDEVNVYTIAITAGVKDGKSKDGTSRFLNDLDALQSTKVWYDFLMNNLANESYTINEIYRLYNEFYQDKESLKLIEEDLIDALKKSVEMIDKTILDPKSYPNSKKDGMRIKKNSLRGNSVFVQMARCKVKSMDDVEILERYAYEKVENAMTFESNRLEDNGLLLADAKIKKVKGKYDSHKISQVKNEASDPSSPIYLSYTPNGLIERGNILPHENAMYYAIGIKEQPIGIMSLDELKKKNN